MDNKVGDGLTITEAATKHDNCPTCYCMEPLDLPKPEFVSKRYITIEEARMKAVEAVRSVGVQHENVAGCLHTEGRIKQMRLDIEAINEALSPDGE